MPGDTVTRRLGADRTPTPGVTLIAHERARQISQEGWTPEHDDGHANDLVLAAIAYCYEGIRQEHPMALAVWPWDEEWWKPSDRIRNLEKAGALIAAELDRLSRAWARTIVYDCPLTGVNDDSCENPFCWEHSVQYGDDG